MGGSRHAETKLFYGSLASTAVLLLAGLYLSFQKSSNYNVAFELTFFSQYLLQVAGVAAIITAVLAYLAFDPGGRPHS